MTEKNKVIYIDDMDKNLGAATADKSDLTFECRRQLYDQSTYLKLSEGAKNDLIGTLRFQLKSIKEKHFYKGNCSFKEAKFLLSNLNGYKIPHFYIIWKILKNPMVARPIVAGYNWILTPASIFVNLTLF